MSQFTSNIKQDSSYALDEAISMSWLNSFKQMNLFLFKEMCENSAATLGEVKKNDEPDVENKRAD